MKELKQYFDEYTIKARILPGLTVIVPLVIVSGFFLSKIELSLNVLFIVGLLSFLSIISRNLGKKKEDKIVEKLGGFQTTILLRYSDSTIDTFTKTRYHKYLNDNIDNLPLPLIPEDEDANKSKSDDMYNSAVRWLRNNRRDKKKYPLVNKDLITYGYARNLLGLKTTAILIYILILCAGIIYLYLNESIAEIYKNTNYLFSLIIVLLSVVVLIFGITKKIVISQGFAYARTILETCE